MIDIHTHILPGIDDGAADERQALLMARAARRKAYIPSSLHLIIITENTRTPAVKFAITSLS